MYILSYHITPFQLIPFIHSKLEDDVMVCSSIVVADIRRRHTFTWVTSNVSEKFDRRSVTTEEMGCGSHSPSSNPCVRKWRFGAGRLSPTQPMSQNIKTELTSPKRLTTQIERSSALSISTYLRLQHTQTRYKLRIKRKQTQTPYQDIRDIKTKEERRRLSNFVLHSTSAFYILLKLSSLLRFIREIKYKVWRESCDVVFSQVFLQVIYQMIRVYIWQFTNLVCYFIIHILLGILMQIRNTE